MPCHPSAGGHVGANRGPLSTFPMCAPSRCVDAREMQHGREIQHKEAPWTRTPRCAERDHPLRHVTDQLLPEADAGKVIQSQILPLQARCLSTGAVLADLADLALKHKQPGQCRRRRRTTMSGNSVGLSPSLCAPQPGDDKMGSFYIELQLRLLGARAHMLRSQGDGRHEQCWVERDRAAGRVRGLRVGLGEEVRRSLTLAGTPITLPASGISNP